jgi:hypothetical protein
MCDLIRGKPEGSRPWEFLFGLDGGTRGDVDGRGKRKGRPHLIRNCGRGLLAALLLLSYFEGGVDTIALAQEQASNKLWVAQATPADERVGEYIRARQKFDEASSQYWKLIIEKRRARIAKRRNNQTVLIDDYVLTQPPVYTGPPKPANLPRVPEQAPPVYVPVIADFIKSAAQYFNFVPERPQHEIDYKREYARVASSVGLTKEQVVRIYGFESGGNGTYDVQAGLEYSTPRAQAINTALGYNQLLNTNSVELMAEDGEQFVQALERKARGLTGVPKRMLESKIKVVLAMIRFCRTVPDVWNEHDKLANTPQGLGVHAMILDVDVGPLLQAQKLVNSVTFARNRGYHGVLTAAELEMMNLTGDGNGLEMVMMSQAMRNQVPTANFFQQSAYGRNPVAIRNNVVAKLIAATDAKMDKEGKLQGARDLADAF